MKNSMDDLKKLPDSFTLNSELKEALFKM